MSEHNRIASEKTLDNTFWSILKEAFTGSNRDFTEGSIGISIFILSIPMITEMFAESLFVIVDIFYDHFLAADWSAWSEEPLALYAARTYQLVIDQEAVMPERVKQMLPYMMRDNWLVNYGNIEGIQRALSGMARRASFESKMEESVEDLKNSYSEFRGEFDRFFPELKNWADEWLLKNIPA